MCLIYGASVPICVVNRFKRCLCCVISTINKRWEKEICLKICYSLRPCIRITWNTSKMDEEGSVNLDLNVSSRKLCRVVGSKALAQSLPDVWVFLNFLLGWVSAFYQKKKKRPVNSVGVDIKTNFVLSATLFNTLEEVGCSSVITPCYIWFVSIIIKDNSPRGTTVQRRDQWEKPYLTTSSDLLSKIMSWLDTLDRREKLLFDDGTHRAIYCIDTRHLLCYFLSITWFACLVRSLVKCYCLLN